MLVEIYRWLLHLFPPEYRSAFGREMTAVFQQAQADAQNRGTISHAVFGIREFTGLIRSAVRERARDSVQWEWRSANSQTPAGASSIGSTFDGLPGVYTCEHYFPSGAHWFSEAYCRLGSSMQLLSLTSMVWAIPCVCGSTVLKAASADTLQLASRGFSHSADRYSHRRMVWRRWC
jgi:hypothetical protein